MVHYRAVCLRALNQPARKTVARRYAMGDYEIDVETYELKECGLPKSVEPQVFDLIPFLIAERHRVVTKFELLDAVWGNRFVRECAMTSRIRSARKALRDDGKRQEVTRTTHGKGYRFVAQVTEVTTGSTDDVS